MSVDAFIAKLESKLGTKGRPNEMTNWYAARNGAFYAREAWCNMFTTWASYHSGNYDAVCFGKDWAYTVAYAQAFKDKGQWHQGADGIRRGDIVFFDWEGSNAIAHIDHVGVVTDVNGRDILTIEGNTSDSVARRVRLSETIVGYGRPKYKEAASVSTYTVKAGDTLSKIGREVGVRWEDIASLNGIRAPYNIDIGQVLRLPGRAPAPNPEPAVPTVSLSNLEFGDRNDDVKDFQNALKAKGYNPGPVDGVFGNQTKSACAAFQRAQGWTGDGANGLPGPRTVAALGLRLTGSTSAPAGPADVSADGEPKHDYRRVSYGGKTVNARTKAMLEKAAEIFGQGFTLTQGSYNTGVGASAGTHDGGGVVDISVSGWSRSKMDRAVQALRRVGLVAWLRVPPSFSFHIHAVAVGDREMSPAAKSQISQWRRDRDGLAAQGPDPAPDPYPAWTNKYR